MKIYKKSYIDESSGLLYLPTLGSDKLDSQDYEAVMHIYSPTAFPVEISDGNKAVLERCVATAQSKKPNIVVVEIGIGCRFGQPYEISTTHSICKNFRKGDIYIGVDIEDRSFITNPEKGMYTVQGSSSNTELIISYVEQLTGYRNIDVLFIDGDHSVKQVLDDWRLVKYVDIGNTVLMHDINYHPGPVALLEVINPAKFKVVKHCSVNDWGIGELTRLAY